MIFSPSAPYQPDPAAESVDLEIPDSGTGLVSLRRLKDESVKFMKLLASSRSR